eukprot:TRINITY_DN13926_c0_g1_i2.p1 TRINITY_DN13926_c0_g1~~TRINITY_DN13926_c0_g1_i2.p1  ORF type:complete len:133 (-),score=11.92 TRINITY_DN13926_c0_g1_i2:271-669(-)
MQRIAHQIPSIKSFPRSSKVMRRRSRRYQLTTDEVRREMLDCVLLKGLSVFRAAGELNIKYSTAKTIWKIYMTEGRIDKRRRRKAANKPSSHHEASGEENSGVTSQEAPEFGATLLGPDFWAINLTKHFNTK